MVSVPAWKPETAAPFSHAAAPGAVPSSPSAPRGNCIAGFPKRVRLLRSTDFRQVYGQGRKVSGRCFVAFCAAIPDVAGPRIGFTTPRALGSAVVRNRIKRRVREAVRLRLARLNPRWSIVINPRRHAAEAPFGQLEEEVERLFLQCDAWS